MTRVRFQVEGRPVPWKRQRTNGKTRFPAEGQKEAKEAVQRAFKAAVKGRTVCHPKPAVAMDILAVFPLPQRIPKGDGRRMGSPHVSTPDADNIAKLVKDALNGIAYDDDAQVYSLTVRKIYSDHARTSVTIEYFGAECATRHLRDEEAA